MGHSFTRYGAVCLYYAVGIRLPDRGPLRGVARWARQELCRRFVDECGARVNLGSGVNLGDGRNVRIGDQSGLGRGCCVYGGVVIGCEVMVGPEVAFLSVNHRKDRRDVPIGRQGMTDANPPRVEDGAWIGLRAVILPGLVIGEGAVVGAGAVVTTDVAPFSIVGGNPAVVIGTRPPSDE